MTSQVITDMTTTAESALLEQEILHFNEQRMMRNKAKANLSSSLSGKHCPGASITNENDSTDSAGTEGGRSRQPSEQAEYFPENGQNPGEASQSEDNHEAPQQRSEIPINRVIPMQPETVSEADQDSSQQIVSGIQSNRQGNSNEPPNEQKTEKPSIHELSLVKYLADNSPLMNTMANLLNRESRVINNWKHLAYVFGATTDITSVFELHAEHSPTEELFVYLQTWKPEMTVGELKIILQMVYRNDIIQKLTEASQVSGATTLPKYRDVMMVCDLVSGESAFLQLLKEKLDMDSRAVGNWKSVAAKCNIPKRTIDQLGVTKCSPTSQLFHYVSVSQNFESLTVETLKDHLETMKRFDVLRIFKKYIFNETALVKDILLPDCDLLSDVSERLDKDLRAIKGWRNLAYRLKIPNEIYEGFDESKGKAKDPTKLLFLWLKASFPDITVGRVLEALRKIDRNDVYETLKDGVEMALKGDAADDSDETIKQTVTDRVHEPPFGTVHHRVHEPPRGTVQEMVSGTYDGTSGPQPSPAAYHQQDLTGERRLLNKDDKLSMKASDIPYRVYSQICVMLDQHNPFFRDFRMLAEELGVERERIRWLEQKDNQTDWILRNCCRGLTVNSLLEILKTKLEREDVAREIENWILTNR